VRTGTCPPFVAHRAAPRRTSPHAYRTVRYLQHVVAEPCEVTGLGDLLQREVARVAHPHLAVDSSGGILLLRV
jgi:hypothetical protein